jgi:PAS domain S-box-containing protein
MSDLLEVLSQQLDKLEFETAAAQVRYSMRETMLAVGDGVLYVAMTHPGRILACNAVFERMFGYREAELVGQPVEMLIPERLRAQHRLHRQNYIARPTTRSMGQGLSMKLFGQTKAGEEKLLGISLTPMVLPTRLPVVMLIVTFVEG